MEPPREGKQSLLAGGLAVKVVQRLTALSRYALIADETSALPVLRSWLQCRRFSG